MSERASTDELRDAIRAAARWYTRLQAGAAGEGASYERERCEWARWLAASPQHRRAWQEIEATLAQIGRVPADLAGPALRGAAAERRRLLRKLAVVAALSPLPWVAYRAGPWPLAADYRTGVGERRRLTLPDGSLLALNTDSAVDVVFSELRREIRLRRGEILVATAPDPTAVARSFAARPFVVRTEHGLVRALGTRFTVRVAGERTMVSVLEDAVRIAPSGGEPVTIAAGQGIVFDGSGASAAGRVDAGVGSWLDGRLVAVDMPLAQWLDELGRYRAGLLSCDPAIAGWKISGASAAVDAVFGAVGAGVNWARINSRFFSRSLAIAH